MARIVGGIGASHSPTIGFAKDTGKQSDPAWQPIFEGFDAIRSWVHEKKVEVLFMIYNDHITSFFLDHYSAYVLGIDDVYLPADEGGGPRTVSPASGHLGLSQHIGMSLVADEFDMSFFQGKPVDHGLLSPLSMMSDANYPENLNVAIMATGGLSHQVHGERAGFLNEAWDAEFLELLEKQPERLVNMRIAQYAEKAGMEGSEVIMWLIMRGALSDKVQLVHKQTYAPSMTNIATLVFDDLGGEPDAAAVKAHQEHIGFELGGAAALQGTYPFTHSRSHANLRINRFLHALVQPAHRARFVNDFEALATDHGLTEEEKDLIRNRKWIEMIRRGVIFFVLEKMAAVLGVSNPEVYAAFRGETIDQFQATRKVSMKYSVAGGEKLKEIEHQ
ncbi:MAG: gallate dioxygenase [Betaproteobacteria bacterium]|nr:gallate dioxygenase [Betaproteobacteria bacterium]